MSKTATWRDGSGSRAVHRCDRRQLQAIVRRRELGVRGDGRADFRRQPRGLPILAAPACTMRCATASRLPRRLLPVATAVRGPSGRALATSSDRGDHRACTRFMLRHAGPRDAASPNQHLMLLDPTLMARICMRMRRPLPVLDLRHVVAVFVDVELVLDQLVAEGLLLVRGDVLQAAARGRSRRWPDESGPAHCARSCRKAWWWCLLPYSRARAYSRDWCAGKSAGESATDSRGTRTPPACRMVNSESKSRSDSPCGCSV